MIRGRAAPFWEGLSWLSSTPNSESRELTSISEDWLAFAPTAGGGASGPCPCAGAFDAGGWRVAVALRIEDNCIYERTLSTILFFSSIPSAPRSSSISMSLLLAAVRWEGVSEWYAITGSLWFKKKFFCCLQAIWKDKETPPCLPSADAMSKGCCSVERDQGHCQAPHGLISSCGRVPAIFSNKAVLLFLKETVPQWRSSVISCAVIRYLIFMSHSAYTSKNQFHN